MKRAKSRFSTKPSFLEGGGLAGLAEGAAGLNPLIGLASTAATAIGAGFDALGNSFTKKFQVDTSSANPYAADAAQKYEKTMNEKSTFGKIGDALPMGLGVGFKMADAIAKATPWGQKKYKNAMDDFNTMQNAGVQKDSFMKANQAMNELPKLKAFEFGMPMARAGLKLKPRDQRELYSKNSPKDESSRFKNLKTKFNKK